MGVKVGHLCKERDGIRLFVAHSLTAGMVQHGEYGNVRTSSYDDLKISQSRNFTITQSRNSGVHTSSFLTPDPSGKCGQRMIKIRLDHTCDLIGRDHCS